MNLTTLTLAARGLSSAINYLRDKDDEQQRNTYDALIQALKNNDADQLPGDATATYDVFDAARKQAGAITRASHERLDRRRAAFAAAAPDRKARQLASKKRLKKSSDSGSGSGTGSDSGLGAGTITGILAGAGALAAGGWALWEFYLRDKFQDDDATASETTSHAAAPNAGPLSEEPAERDEELLSSLEEQLSTLDTLGDDQRKATD